MDKESRAFKKRPCGIETEFGMTLRGTKATKAAGVFIENVRRVWPECEVGRIGWDSTNRIKEDPDAADDHAMFKNPQWKYEDNFFLNNGARLYLDCHHAESSTPLCRGSLELLRWNRACYAIIDQLRERYHQKDGYEFSVYRNNVASDDGAFQNSRVSFACHENYTTRRDIPLQTLIQRFGCGFFPARIPIIGVGKIGSDCGLPQIDFQMSQRADFFTETHGGRTTHDRPIYNTRDVPYADRNRFRRMHVICGDSNMLSTSELLKISLTDCALKMIEDDELGQTLEFLDPVKAIKQISRDLEFSEKYDLAYTKQRRTILDILMAYADLFGNYISLYHPHDETLKWTVQTFISVLERLWKRDYAALYGVLDWVTKKHIIERYLNAKGLSWASAKAKQLDCEYANNDHQKGFYFKCFPDANRAFFSPEERIYAEKHPPNSRSRWIVECIKKYRAEICDSNYWETITGKSSLKINTRLCFSDPTIEYDPLLAEAAYALPFEECADLLNSYNVL